MNSDLKARIFLALEFLLIISIVLLILIPFSPTAESLPSRDSGVFLYTGWRVLKGEIPYLQVWDHKPPVIYYLDAFGLMLSPDSTWGVWFIEVISLGLAALVGYAILKQLYGIYPAIFVTFLWLFSSFYLLAGGNLTNEYGLPFQFLILWLFYKSEAHFQYHWRGFAIGALSAILFFTRQNAVAIPFAIGIYLIISRISQREFRRFFREISIILAGALTVSGVIVGYFALKEALPAFWDIAFLYNFAYTDERNTADRFYALMQGLNQLENVGLAQLSLLGWTGALAFMGFKREGLKPERRPFIWMALIALPIEFWMVSLGGRPRIPYFLTVLPIFSIFAGFSIWLIFESALQDIPIYAKSMMVILFVISLGAVFYADYTETVQNFMKPGEVSELTTYIRNNSESSDYVLMWGAAAAYNFDSRRASPTRFVYQTPLYNQKNKEDVIEFLQDILSKKPRLIVLAADDKFSDFRFAYRDNQIGSLMDQVKRQYQNPVKITGWTVFRYSGQ